VNRASTLAVVLGQADGTFVRGQEFSGQGAVATDLNGDGAIDVELIRNASLLQIQGHADGTFEERTPLNISTSGKELLGLVTPRGTEFLLASDSESSRLSSACLARRARAALASSQGASHHAVVVLTEKGAAFGLFADFRR